MRRAALVGAALAVAFLVGWGASDLIKTDRLMIMNEKGDMRISMGTDPGGGGFLVIMDYEGQEVFAVKGGKVTIRDASPQTPLGSASTQVPPQQTERVVQLIRMEAILPDVSADDRITLLRQEADDLEEQARNAETEEARLADEERSFKKRNPYGLWEPASKERQAELRKQAAAFRDEAKRKDGEANKLERQLDTKLQRVYCWDGKVEVILETVRDLSLPLNKIPARGFLDFRGIRREMDPLGREVFEVTSLSATTRPDGFADWSK